MLLYAVHKSIMSVIESPIVYIVLFAQVGIFGVLCVMLYVMNALPANNNLMKRRLPYLWQVANCYSYATVNLFCILFFF